MLDRAEKERWTTHIVINESASPSPHNPPPATFKFILSQLGPEGSTGETLDKFVKIVRTSWLSASGAQRTPSSEVGHELFLEERKEGGVVDEVERDRLVLLERYRKEREMARALDVLASRTGEEDSADEEAEGITDAPYVSTSLPPPSRLASRTTH